MVKVTPPMLQLSFAVLAAAAPGPKVIVMVLGDDYGWWNIDMPGHNPEARTPHMLGLAREGVVLDRHYVFKYCPFGN